MNAGKNPSRPNGKPAKQDKDQKRRGPDWEAIQRDYRTDKFSLRELAAKYGTDPSTIVRKIKRDQAVDPQAWPKDLTKVVRAATNAKLMAELVNSEVNAGQRDANTVVLAAAELNKQIILGHRSDLRRLREVAIGLLEEVVTAQVTAEDAERLTAVLAGEDASADGLRMARIAVERMTSRGDRVRDTKALAEVFERVRKGEREAFGITPDAGGGDDEPPPDIVKDPAAFYGWFRAQVAR